MKIDVFYHLDGGINKSTVSGYDQVHQLMIHVLLHELSIISYINPHTHVFIVHISG